MDDALFIVETTLGGSLNEAEVGIWIQSIIDLNLASCAQINKIRSIYYWNKEIKSEPEWSIRFKTTKSKTNNLVNKIESTHPYEVPEILFWGAHSNDSYIQWLEGE